MKKKNIFKSALAAALAMIMVFGAAPLSGLADIDLPSLSLKASAATTEDGLFEYRVITWNEPCTVAITRCKEIASEEVVVPKTIEGYEVTYIADEAFKNCTGITSIVIPDSVTSIIAGAFYGCTSLTEITVSPDNKNYLSMDGVLFNKDGSELLVYPRGNKRSTYIIPDSVTSIGERVFFGLTSLAEITIPDSVTSIGGGAFSGCTSLSKVTLSNNLKVIEYGAFYGCTSLAEITIPDSVTSIGSGAFSGCTSLAEITIPDSVTEIRGTWNSSTDMPDGAFSGCTSIAEITIPDSVTTIGSYAFSGCTSLSKVKLSNNLTAIEWETFSGCTSLAEITIPDSVASIGSSAFSGCTSLKEIVIPDSVTSIGWSAFSGCTSLSKVKLSNSLTSIDGSTFSNCTSLKEIVIPDSVTSIDWRAFSGCISLTEITIPDSVTSIGQDSFSNCTSLESVTLGSGVEELGDNWILNCRRLADITVSPESSSFSSVDGVLFSKDGSSLLAYPIGNKRSAYTIPDGVEKVGAKAFYGCRYIESLTIPASVTEIEASALGNCYDIRAVYYSGTREQWKEVVIGADNYMFALINVHCADDTDCTHEWGEWKVVEKATAEKEGLEKRTCSLCNAEETRKIPKLDIVKVTEIVLSDSEKTLTVGKSFTLAATVKPDDAFDRTVTWSSSDPSVATVDENGTVTAIAEGEVIITAESADGVKAECRVTVEKEKESFGKTLLNVITAPFRAIINLFKKLFGKSI